MRRMTNESQAENLTSMLERFILVDAKKFAAKVFEIRSREIDEMMAPKDAASVSTALIKLALDLKK